VFYECVNGVPSYLIAYFRTRKDPGERKDTLESEILCGIGFARSALLFDGEARDKKTPFAFVAPRPLDCF
jgi:hypothetical protein